MNNARRTEKQKQLEMLWSSPNLLTWSRLPEILKKETSGLLVQMLLEAKHQIQNKVTKEDKADE